MHAKSLQLCPTLCDPMDHSPLGSSVYGILQVRILEWPWLPPGDLLDPEIKPVSLMSPALAGGFFTTSVLAWRIPGTGQPGGLPSMGLHRVGHDWSDLAAAAPPGKPKMLKPSSSMSWYLNDNKYANCLLHIVPFIPGVFVPLSFIFKCMNTIEGVVRDYFHFTYKDTRNLEK